MKPKLHPVCELYEKMFNEVASENNINLPGNFVERSTFYEAIHKAGIEAPKNIVEFMQWEESIGLTKFVKKTIRKWERRERKT